MLIRRFSFTVGLLLLYAIYCAVIIAAFSPATAEGAGVTELSCADYYPEAESPDATTVVAELVFTPAGELAGLKCYAEEGEPAEVCRGVRDGGCCDCDVRRGFTPECRIVVTYTNTETAARCFQAYPECYYSDGWCDSASSAFLTEQTTGIAKHSKPRKRKRGRR